LPAADASPVLADQIVPTAEGNVVPTLDGSMQRPLGLASDTDIIVPDYPVPVNNPNYLSHLNFLHRLHR
jgi:hypothetical protein